MGGGNHSVEREHRGAINVLQANQIHGIQSIVHIGASILHVTKCPTLRVDRFGEQLLWRWDSVCRSPLSNLGGQVIVVNQIRHGQWFARQWAFARSLSQPGDNGRSFKVWSMFSGERMDHDFHGNGAKKFRWWLLYWYC
jgi:hypothetical protein